MALLAVVVATLACASRTASQLVYPWRSYTYSDGSNNVWTIDAIARTIEYVGLRGGSSGTYDGGGTKRRTLPEEHITCVIELLESSMNNESIHIQKRVKISGMIVRKDSRGRSIVIIRPGCAEQTQIEGLLRSLVRMGPLADVTLCNDEFTTIRR